MGRPLTFECGDYFFVHAGVRPGRPLDQQDEEDLLWIREEFLDFDGDFGKRIVHGHTPVDVATFKPNRINLDTGACFGGPLTAVLIEGSEVTIF
jgi:diadenosine tetraphosphatase ApaH/serine/threonine PP2A family protein phosphatase